MGRTTVRIRPSRAMSAAVVVVVLGMLVFGAANGAPGFWVLGVLVILGVNVANMVTRRGVATSYLDVDDSRPLPPGRQCTSCGMSLATGDKFCRECGAAVSPRRR